MVENADSLSCQQTERGTKGCVVPEVNSRRGISSGAGFECSAEQTPAVTAVEGADTGEIPCEVRGKRAGARNV
jgi:hypothetical protein